MDPKIQQASNALQALGATDMVDAIKDVINTKSSAEKTRLADEITQLLPPPTQPTTDSIWKIVIWALAIALVVATVALCAGVFREGNAPITKPETVLTVVTTIVGFLGGLFTPSPTAKK